jgi:hypothetical protein
MSDPTPQRRWFHPSPTWLIVGLLLVEGGLWLSERFQWPTWHKGYAVLIAIAVVGVVFVAILLWLAASLLFRWRFQFSIRSLLVLVVVVAVPCSWLAVEMKAARAQHDAVEAIMKLGATVSYDWQVDVDHYYNLLPKAQPPEPAWLRSLLGNDFCWEVQRVIWEAPAFRSRTASRTITDAGLESLRGLKQLQKLSFWGNTELSDADLQHLEGLNQLRELWLNSTPITDGGLKHLRELNQLQTLALEFTGVTDQGLDSLKGLHELRTLYLLHTNVTVAGAAKLQQALPKCAIQIR